MLLPQIRDMMAGGTVLNFFSAFFTSIFSYSMALIFAALALWRSVFGQALVASVWMMLACLSFRNVRDHMFPEEALLFVARDSVTVRLPVAVFIVAKALNAFLSRNSRGYRFPGTGLSPDRQQDINLLSVMIGTYGFQRLCTAALRDEAV